LKDFTQKQGWEIVHQFSDHTGGKTSDRQQFKKRFSAASEKLAKKIWMMAESKDHRLGITPAGARDR
jgi:hypothetical protein